VVDLPVAMVDHYLMKEREGIQEEGRLIMHLNRFIIVRGY